MKIINLGSHSGAAYPDLRFYPSVFDHILEGVAALLLIAVWLSAFYFHANPQAVGAEASYGWMMAGCSLFTFLLLGASAYLPMRFYGLPFRLTDGNAGVQCMLAVRVVRMLNILLNALLLVCLWAVANFRVMTLAMPVFGVLMAATFIAYYVLAYRYR